MDRSPEMLTENETDSLLSFSDLSYLQLKTPIAPKEIQKDVYSVETEEKQCGIIVNVTTPERNSSIVEREIGSYLEEIYYHDIDEESKPTHLDVTIKDNRTLVEMVDLDEDILIGNTLYALYTIFYDSMDPSTREDIFNDLIGETKEVESPDIISDVRILDDRLEPTTTSVKAMISSIREHFLNSFLRRMEGVKLSDNISHTRILDDLFEPTATSDKFIMEYGEKEQKMTINEEILKTYFNKPNRIGTISILVSGVKNEKAIKMADLITKFLNPLSDFNPVFVERILPEGANWILKLRSTMKDAPVDNYDTESGLFIRIYLGKRDDVLHRVYSTVISFMIDDEIREIPMLEDLSFGLQKTKNSLYLNFEIRNPKNHLNDIESKIEEFLTRFKDNTIFQIQVYFDTVLRQFSEEADYVLSKSMMNPQYRGPANELANVMSCILRNSSDFNEDKDTTDSFGVATMEGLAEHYCKMLLPGPTIRKLSLHVLSDYEKERTNNLYSESEISGKKVFSHPEELLKCMEKNI